MTTTYKTYKAPFTRALGVTGEAAKTESPFAEHLQPTEAMSPETRDTLRYRQERTRATGLRAHQPNIVLAITALVILIGGLMEFKEAQPESLPAFKLECPLISHTSAMEDGEPAIPGAKRQVCSWVATR